MSLILSGLVHSTKKKLDWAKGRAVARKLPLADVQAGLEECFGYPGDSAKESRDLLNDVITELKAELSLTDGGHGGDVYTWVVGTKTLHIRGGEEFNGEDPSHGWTVFTNAYCFPTVLKAIGFDVDVKK